MAKRMDPAGLADAGLVFRSLVDARGRLTAHRAVEGSSGKQPVLGSVTAPVLAQLLQQPGRERDVTILAALALVDTQTHPSGIDIRLTLDETIARRAPQFIDEGAKPEHGRRERRSIWVSTELNDYLDFPGVGQVFAIRRDTVEVKSAKRRVETVYGVTSLTPQGASPQRLLSLNRGHWSIENKPS